MRNPDPPNEGSSLQEHADWFSEIASEVDDPSALPDGVARETIEQEAERIYELIQPDIERLDETSYSERQIETLILRSIVPPMSYRAIAMYMSNLSDGTVQESTVRSHWQQAQQKLETAEATLKETAGVNASSDSEPVFVSPEIKRRLKSRFNRRPADSIDELFESLLEQTQDAWSLRRFVEWYVANTNPAQVAVEKELLEQNMSTLSIIVHRGTPSENPREGTAWERVDALTVDGKTFDFAVEESNMGPQEMWRVTLYASDDIHGMEGTSIDDGMAAFREVLHGETSDSPT